VKQWRKNTCCASVNDRWNVVFLGGRKYGEKIRVENCKLIISCSIVQAATFDHGESAWKWRGKRRRAEGSWNRSWVLLLKVRYLCRSQIELEGWCILGEYEGSRAERGRKESGGGWVIGIYGMEL
jgi:hypothetical protein